MYYSKIIKGLSWNFLGTILSQLFIFLAFVFIARKLGVESFGKFSLIYISGLTLSGLFSLAIGQYMVTYISKNNKDTHIISIFLSNILFYTYSIVLFLIIILSLNSEYIIGDILNLENIKLNLFYIIMIFIFELFFLLQKSFLISIEEFKILSIFSISKGFLFLSFVWVFSNGMNIYIGVLISLLLTTIFGFIIIYKKINNINITIKYINSKILKEIINFTVPSFLSSLMVTPVNWILMSLLSSTNNGLIQVALFNAVLRIQNSIVLIGQVVGNIILPILSKNEKSEININQLNILVPLAIGISFSLLLIFFNEIFLLIFGSKYEIKYYKEVFSLQMVTTIFILYKQGFARVLIVKNKMWFTLFSNFLWLTIVIFGAKYLIIDYGVLGISIAIIIAYIINIFFFLPYYVKLDLIPLKYIYSFKIILLWLFVLLFSYAGYILSIKFRLIIIILTLCIIYLILRKKYEKKV